MATSPATQSLAEELGLVVEPFETLDALDIAIDGAEGAGEVQTPVLGPAARDLALGDRVWFRHAKAGELCERFAGLHLVRGEEIVDEVATYRGEGQTFL